MTISVVRLTEHLIFQSVTELLVELLIEPLVELTIELLVHLLRALNGALFFTSAQKSRKYSIVHGKAHPYGTLFCPFSHSLPSTGRRPMP